MRAFCHLQGPHASFYPLFLLSSDLSVFKVTVDTSKKPAAVVPSEAPVAGANTSEAFTPAAPPTVPAATAPELVVENNDAEPLWPDEEEQPIVELISNAEPLWPHEEEPTEELVHDDPLQLLQEQDAVDQDAPPGISLAPKAATNKTKSKRPKFKLRKAKK
jgi:hypothetical protein